MFCLKACKSDTLKKKKINKNSVEAKQKHPRVKWTELMGHGFKGSLEISKRASTAF